ncbi:uncharacterized protein HaLaN_03264 [Haematococcus lacustris]|uniref:Reverse transcriptase domain-containing protein n=1 Tax=Haematococcus lacustris TaxID=44745 RepID=A0A699YDU3_HAELA|nr:uncharacterized protein HaLaN_03264 [Haematococcus lacustris]
MFARVGCARWFSKLDMRSGFLQIPVHPDDQLKTAFWARNRLYCYTRMPFGLKMPALSTNGSWTQPSPAPACPIAAWPSSIVLKIANGMSKDASISSKQGKADTRHQYGAGLQMPMAVS